MFWNPCRLSSACGRAVEDKELAGAYNVELGPEDCITTGKLADLFCEAWNRENENPLKAARWESCPDGDCMILF